jgi:hypothetical protein
MVSVVLEMMIMQELLILVVVRQMGVLLKVTHLGIQDLVKIATQHLHLTSLLVVKLVGITV